MIIHFDICGSKFPKNKDIHKMKRFEGILWNFNLIFVVRDFQNTNKKLRTCTPWKDLQIFIEIQYDIRGWKFTQRKDLKILMKIQSNIWSDFSDHFEGMFNIQKYAVAGPNEKSVENRFYASKSDNFPNMVSCDKTISQNQNFFYFKILLITWSTSRYDIINEKYVIFMSYRSNILSYHSWSILCMKNIKIFSIFFLFLKNLEKFGKHETYMKFIGQKLTSMVSFEICKKISKNSFFIFCTSNIKIWIFRNSCVNLKWNHRNKFLLYELHIWLIFSEIFQSFLNKKN